MDLRFPLILATSALLLGCPGDDDNVAPPVEDVGQDSGDTTDDVGIPDMSVDMGAPDIPAEPGSLNIDPLQLTFEDVRIDDTQSATIAISNTGGSPLVVTNVMLTEFNRMGEPEFVPGDEWDESFVVGAGLFRELEVTYAPHDFAADEGELTLFTNDPNNEIVKVRLTSVNAYMDIETPPFVRFGEVDVGESATKRITLYNRGIDPLTLNDVTVSDVDDVYSIMFDPAELPPTVLEKGEDFIVDVIFTPVNDMTARGTVTIASDDPDQGTVEIPLTGNDPTPCLDINPAVADFGTLAPGTSMMQQITLLNCSQSLPVSVTAIELIDDGGEVFTVANLPDLPVELVPLQTVAFDVAGSLADPGTANGEISVESTDEKSSGVLPLRLTAEVAE